MTRRSRTSLSVPIEEEVRVVCISSSAMHPRMVWLLNQAFGWRFSEWNHPGSTSPEPLWAHYRSEIESGHTLLLTALRTGSALPGTGMKNLDYLLAIRGDNLATLCGSVVIELKTIDTILFAQEIPLAQLKNIPASMLLF